MKRKSTPFLELAEKIANNIDTYWFCCNSLKDGKSKTYFKAYFKPTITEKFEYNHLADDAWMTDIECSVKQNNEFRILALLICHEHYLHYNS